MAARQLRSGSASAAISWYARDASLCRPVSALAIANVFQSSKRDPRCDPPYASASSASWRAVSARNGCVRKCMNARNPATSGSRGLAANALRSISIASDVRPAANAARADS